MQNATLFTGIRFYGATFGGAVFLVAKHFLNIGRSGGGGGGKEEKIEESNINEKNKIQETEKCSCSCCNTKYIITGIIISAAIGTSLIIAKEVYVDNLNTEKENNINNIESDYNFEKAIDYALEFCNDTNKAYNYYDRDCANFVS